MAIEEISMGVWELIPGCLWQGSILGSIIFPADCVITCSPLSEIPSLIGDLFRHDRLHILFPFLDIPQLPDLDLAHGIADLAQQRFDGYGKSRRVLVNCNEGRNRSGLICGLIMNYNGISGVVSKIKAIHPQALSNKVFADYLDLIEPGQ